MEVSRAREKASQFDKNISLILACALSSKRINRLPRWFRFSSSIPSVHPPARSATFFSLFLIARSHSRAPINRRLSVCRSVFSHTRLRALSFKRTSPFLAFSSRCTVSDVTRDNGFEWILLYLSITRHLHPRRAFPGGFAEMRARASADRPARAIGAAASRGSIEMD